MPVECREKLSGETRKSVGDQRIMNEKNLTVFPFEIRVAEKEFLNRSVYLFL